MSLTISTKTYTLDSNPTPDSARYTGPANTAVVKDIVLLKRQAPKPTKDFAGVVRSSIKVVKTVMIGVTPRDLIGELTFSYPVGTLAADVTALRVDASNALANAMAQTLIDNAKLAY